MEMGNLRQHNKNEDKGKRLWTAEGAVLIDKTGNVKLDNSLRIIEDQIEDYS